MTFTRDADEISTAAFFVSTDISGESLWGLQLTDCLIQMVEEHRKLTRETMALTWSQRIDRTLLRAAGYCLDAGIPVSPQEGSRFYKIADWLLPANAGTKSRIKKLKAHLS